MKDKFILDACCGGRMFWFNKNHPNVLYIDNRKREKGHSKFRPNHAVLPDEDIDFRDMPYKNKSFKLVVFDPPHIFGKENSLINQYYGSLNKETWREDIKKGFNESWRVLDDYGVLIFKWNEVRIPKKEILELIGREPLFGHQVGGRMQTHWLCFMKIDQKIKEVCGKTKVSKLGNYYRCRLNIGHAGRHKWWTSCGNASAYEWGNTESDPIPDAGRKEEADG